MKKILIIGASRGIGGELTSHFAHMGHEVFGVSRSPAQHCQWIAADMATPEGIQHLLENIGDKPLDALIYCSGIWEKDGFSEHFDFKKTNWAETQKIMLVNLVAPIEITKGLAKNLALSNNPRAIYLGALSGLENKASQQVAYGASKFGLRGAIQGLRKGLATEEIGFSVINLGNVATPEVLADIKAGDLPVQTPIAIADIINTIEMIFSLSPTVEVGDINLSQKNL